MDSRGGCSAGVSEGAWFGWDLVWLKSMSQ